MERTLHGALALPSQPVFRPWGSGGTGRYDLRHNNIRLVNSARKAGIIPLQGTSGTGTPVITKANVHSFRKGGEKP